jgi:hypothetical protein
MRADLEALGLAILPFTAEEAEIAGQIWQQTRQYGLSLGDRACLSLGIRLNAQVLTADQVWSDLNLPITVHIIRSPIQKFSPNEVYSRSGTSSSNSILSAQSSG